MDWFSGKTYGKAWFSFTPKLIGFSGENATNFEVPPISTIQFIRFHVTRNPSTPIVLSFLILNTKTK